MPKFFVSVRFINSSGKLSPKNYLYRTNMSLVKGCKYYITASSGYVYENPVVICDIKHTDEMDIVQYKNLMDIATMTITKASLSGVMVDDCKTDHTIKGVWFNKEKRTTVVKWNDGTVTMVPAAEVDTYNMECGLAMCYMKRWSFNNRSAFNEVFKKWIPKEEIKETEETEEANVEVKE